MYSGGDMLRDWARECRCFVVSAIRGHNSVIINPLGSVMARSSEYSRIIMKTINLDSVVLNLYESYQQLGRIARTYGSEVDVEVANDENICLLTCWHSQKHIGDITDEFALEPLDKLLDRSRQVRKQSVDRHQDNPPPDRRDPVSSHSMIKGTP